MCPRTALTWINFWPEIVRDGHVIIYLSATAVAIRMNPGSRRCIQRLWRGPNLQ